MKRTVELLVIVIMVWLGTLGILEKYPLSLLGQVILVVRELLLFLLAIVGVMDIGKLLGHNE